jgi:hypothetical protein
MAYDRYERERGWREGRPDYREDPRRRDWEDERGRGDFDPERAERGFFERAADEVRSWFGDEEDERGRREEELRGRGYGRHPQRSRDLDDEDRSRRPMRSSASDRDYRADYREDLDRGYRPLAGDYSRSGSDQSRRDFERGSRWDRDEYRRTSFAGSRAKSNPEDLHYEEWRRRQMADLDRDYDEYRRECEARFESDFRSWRERRQSKRQLLRDVREQMEVVGSDDQHVGNVDRVAGDRIIFAKSDPEAGGVHHSLSCSEIDRVERDRVILEVPAEQARQRWRDESRERALFEREDQGRAGPHVLDRSFSGTYR